jgi:hypothetical protein
MKFIFIKYTIMILFYLLYKYYKGFEKIILVTFWITPKNYTFYKKA